MAETRRQELPAHLGPDADASKVIAAGQDWFFAFGATRLPVTALWCFQVLEHGPMEQKHWQKDSEDAIKAEALMKETMIVVSEALILCEMQGKDASAKLSAQLARMAANGVGKIHPALHMETWLGASVLHHCKLWFAVSYHLMSGSRNSVSSQSQWLFYFAARLTSFQYEIRFPQVEF